MRMKRWFRIRLRQYIKRPEDLQRAQVIRRRLAFFYVFVAWNALGLCIINYLKEKYPSTPNEKKTPALWYLRLMGENQANILTVKGLSSVSHEHFDATNDTFSSLNNRSILSSLTQNYRDDTEEVMESEMNELPSSEFDR